MNFTICSRKRVDQHLARGWYTHMISISDPCGTLRGELRTGNDLLLDFDDNFPEQNRPRRVLASEADIRAICSMANRMGADDDDVMMLIHCGRGRSRSTSAAIILLRALLETEIEACRRLFATAPNANPNGWMLRLADRLYDWKLHETCSTFKVKG